MAVTKWRESTANGRSLGANRLGGVDRPAASHTTWRIRHPGKPEAPANATTCDPQATRKPPPCDPHVTQRVFSRERSQDGSEFARGNWSVDTEGFRKSQMTLNCGLKLREALCSFLGNGRNSVPGCSTPKPPPGHPQALWWLTGRHPEATLRLPGSYPQAPPRLPRGSPKGQVQGERNRELEGGHEIVIPRTNPPKRGRSPRIQTVTPSAK
jgi:hypothetical protein